VSSELPLDVGLPLRSANAWMGNPQILAQFWDKNKPRGDRWAMSTSTAIHSIEGLTSDASCDMCEALEPNVPQHAGDTGTAAGTLMYPDEL
jgi:hypothetical protein